MSKKITIRTTEISSTQEWTSDPDLVEFYVDAEFVTKAKKAIKFMHEVDVDFVCLWWAFGFETYREADFDDEPNDNDIEHDAKRYTVFEPEYRISGCHAKVYKDGTLSAILEMKYTAEEVWCSIGKIADIESELGEPIYLESCIPVRHWDAYNAEGTVNSHQFNIDDQRQASGQAYVTVGALEGDLDDMISVTMEVNTNPLNGIDHVPCAHVHFDGDNLAFSLFKIGNRILMRPENEVRLSGFRQQYFAPGGKETNIHEDFFWIE